MIRWHPLWLGLALAQPAAAQHLDGLWRSDGYGYLLEVRGDTLRFREVTAVSCLPSFVAARVPAPTGAAAAFRAVTIPITFLVMGGVKEGYRLHVNGAASDILIHRVSALPEACRSPTPDTPVSNFDVFATTWAEHYGFFGLKGVDWPRIVRDNRRRVTADTKPSELFAILRGMIEPLHDAHTFLGSETDTTLRFHGERRGPNSLDRGDFPKAFALVEQHYLRTPIRSWCNGQLQFGMLDGGTAYLRIKSFSGYGADDTFESGLVALEAAMDTIFAESAPWKGLVIDVRINGGGDDPYGLAIASRLATQEYLAYSKEARADPQDQDRWTPAQPSRVRPSTRPGYRGPVVELIGIHSVSAAETFSQALMGRRPHIPRIGENTQGVFSDVLVRTLPNGWRFGLPNERFVTDGKAYDGTGIAPDAPVPVFPKSDLEAGRDGALERALSILSGTPR